MATQKYQLFFVIGKSMKRPYNSLEFWPSDPENGVLQNEELPMQILPTRRLFEIKA
ncbi:hypothetical protein N9954_05695 [Maribacter sp.]|nr:hypothetical protein [Maribacter sp.]